METVLTAFQQGGFPRRESEAVDILIAALRGRSESAREAALRQLRRLTGQDFGLKADAWEQWWKTAAKDGGAEDASKTAKN
jgi:hypothetical protein